MTSLDRPLKNFIADESSEVNMIKKPFIRKMYLAAFSCLLLAVSMGLATGYSAPATFDMEHRKTSAVKPSDDDITWIGSILALGAMTGGISAGPLADAVGRKDALIYNVLPFAGGWLAICYVNTITGIIIGRFFCGFACGIISVTVPMYCVEISTTDVRGILGSSFQGFLVIGNLLSVIVGSYLTWKQLALNGAAFVTAAVTLFCFMPPSPRWLLARGRLPEAIRVMHRLQGGFVDSTKECNAIFSDLENQPKGLLSISECKLQSVYKPALISVALMFFQQASGANAVFFYSTSIFEKSKDFLDPKTSTVILGAVQVTATLLSNLVIDKTGRKVLLILSGVFMSISLVCLGTFYYIASTDADFQTKHSWIPLVSLVSFVYSFSTGFGAIPWLLAAEMSPVRARSTIGGLATLSNGLFAFIVTKTFSDLKVLIGHYGTFWCYSCISLLGALFVFLMVPETKGKKLDEIEKLFQRKATPSQQISISVIS